MECYNLTENSDSIQTTPTTTARYSRSQKCQIPELGSSTLAELMRISLSFGYELPITVNEPEDTVYPLAMPLILYTNACVLPDTVLIGILTLD
ncbi:MAG: hypothetical protein U0X71_02645 [Sphingobacteriaceae bacterium]